MDLAIGRMLQTALGLGADQLTVPQMLLRTVVVYSFTVLVVRWGEKRFFGKNTAFDLVLSIILGSVISRAINGGAPFFPTLLASAGLVGLHRMLVVVAFRSDRVGDWIKGQARVLVRDGEVDWDAMEESHLTEQDLLGADCRARSGTCVRSRWRVWNGAETSVWSHERASPGSWTGRSRTMSR
jgi:hypothetical protein